jgi:hypothetical protein
MPLILELNEEQAKMLKEITHHHGFGTGRIRCEITSRNSSQVEVRIGEERQF